MYGVCSAGQRHEARPKAPVTALFGEQLPMRGINGDIAVTQSTLIIQSVRVPVLLQGRFKSVVMQTTLYDFNVNNGALLRAPAQTDI